MLGPARKKLRDELRHWKKGYAALLRAYDGLQRRHSIALANEKTATEKAVEAEAAARRWAREIVALKKQVRAMQSRISYDAGLQRISRIAELKEITHART